MCKLLCKKFNSYYVLNKYASVFNSNWFVLRLIVQLLFCLFCFLLQLYFLLTYLTVIMKTFLDSVIEAKD